MLPINFKGKGKDLKNYRIYGQTSRNLFDMKTFAETAYQKNATVNYSENSLIFTATNQDAYVNEVYSQSVTPSALMPACINVQPLTAYTITMNSPYKCYISWLNDSGVPVHSYTSIPNNQSSYTFTTPENCTKLIFRLGKYVTNIGDTFTISNIMLNAGSTPLPYEPYGESVGDRTANLFEAEIVQGGLYGATGAEFDSDNRCRSSYILLDAGTYTISISSIHTIGLFIFSSTNVFETFVSYSDSPITFSLETVKKVRFGFATYSGIVSITPSDISNIMLNIGSTPLPYEPYGYRVPVTVEGKNLLQNTATSQTINGVTFTVNANGSVTCNGQATRVIYFAFNSSFTLPVGEFVLTGCPTGGGDSSYRMYIQTDNLSPQKFYTDTGNGVTIDNTNAGTVYSARILIVNGYSCNNLTFYPMIRKADIEDDTYEPYHAPITTPIYLPEQIRKVGSEAEYIDYGEQKLHRVRKNLFDYTTHRGNIYGYLWQNGNIDTTNHSWSISDYIPCTGTIFTINQIGGNDPAICLYDENKQYITGKNYSTGGATFKSAVTIESSTVASYIRFSYKLTGTDEQVDDLTKIMLNSGSEPLPYEPYIENTDLDVTLPALPTLTGTNVLSVGTEVQPSKVYLKGKLKRTIYGWHVNPDISNSSNAVTYLKDAIGMTPASMGSTTFDYGSWENAFFMPKPCMLKSNGKVDYYLDPNDYTKKLNGTASDISNPNYDGNAMM